MIVSNLSLLLEPPLSERSRGRNRDFTKSIAGRWYADTSLDRASHLRLVEERRNGRFATHLDRELGKCDGIPCEIYGEKNEIKTSVALSPRRPSFMNVKEAGRPVTVRRQGRNSAVIENELVSTRDAKGTMGRTNVAYSISEGVSRRTAKRSLSAARNIRSTWGLRRPPIENVRKDTPKRPTPATHTKEVEAWRKTVMEAFSGYPQFIQMGGRHFAGDALHWSELPPRPPPIGNIENQRGVIRWRWEGDGLHANSEAAVDLKWVCQECEAIVGYFREIAEGEREEKMRSNGVQEPKLMSHARKKMRNSRRLKKCRSRKERRKLEERLGKSQILYGVPDYGETTHTREKPLTGKTQGPRICLVKSEKSQISCHSSGLEDDALTESSSSDDIQANPGSLQKGIDMDSCDEHVWQSNHPWTKDVFQPEINSHKPYEKLIEHCESDEESKGRAGVKGTREPEQEAENWEGGGSLAWDFVTTQGVVKGEVEESSVECRENEENSTVVDGMAVRLEAHQNGDKVGITKLKLLCNSKEDYTEHIAGYRGMGEVHTSSLGGNGCDQHHEYGRLIIDMHTHHAINESQKEWGIVESSMSGSRVVGTERTVVNTYNVGVSLDTGDASNLTCSGEERDKDGTGYMQVANATANNYDGKHTVSSHISNTMQSDYGNTWCRDNTVAETDVDRECLAFGGIASIMEVGAEKNQMDRTWSQHIEGVGDRKIDDKLYPNQRRIYTQCDSMDEFPTYVGSTGERGGSVEYEGTGEGTAFSATGGKYEQQHDGDSYCIDEPAYPTACPTDFGCSIMECLACPSSDKAEKEEDGAWQNEFEDGGISAADSSSDQYTSTTHTLGKFLSEVRSSGEGVGRARHKDCEDASRSTKYINCVDGPCVSTDTKPTPKCEYSTMRYFPDVVKDDKCKMENGALLDNVEGEGSYVTIGTSKDQCSTNINSTEKFLGDTISAGERGGCAEYEQPGDEFPHVTIGNHNGQCDCDRYNVEECEDGPCKKDEVRDAHNTHMKNVNTTDEELADQGYLYMDDFVEVAPAEEVKEDNIIWKNIINSSDRLGVDAQDHEDQHKGHSYIIDDFSDCTGSTAGGEDISINRASKDLDGQHDDESCSADKCKDFSSSAEEEINAIHQVHRRNWNGGDNGSAHCGYISMEHIACGKPVKEEGGNRHSDLGCDEGCVLTGSNQVEPKAGPCYSIYELSGYASSITEGYGKGEYVPIDEEPGKSSGQNDGNDHRLDEFGGSSNRDEQIDEVASVYRARGDIVAKIEDCVDLCSCVAKKGDKRTRENGVEYGVSNFADKCGGDQQIGCSYSTSEISGHVDSRAKGCGKGEDSPRDGKPGYYYEQYDGTDHSLNEYQDLTNRDDEIEGVGSVWGARGSTGAKRLAHHEFLSMKPCANLDSCVMEKENKRAWENRVEDQVSHFAASCSGDQQIGFSYSMGEISSHISRIGEGYGNGVEMPTYGESEDPYAQHDVENHNVNGYREVPDKVQEMEEVSSVWGARRSTGAERKAHHAHLGMEGYTDLAGCRANKEDDRTWQSGIEDEVSHAGGSSEDQYDGGSYSMVKIPDHAGSRTEGEDSACYGKGEDTRTGGEPGHLNEKHGGDNYDIDEGRFYSSGEEVAGDFSGVCGDTRSTGSKIGALHEGPSIEGYTDVDNCVAEKQEDATSQDEFKSRHSNATASSEDRHVDHSCSMKKFVVYASSTPEGEDSSVCRMGENTSASGDPVDLYEHEIGENRSVGEYDELPNGYEQR